ncbi:transposase, partial [Caldibacillus thermoamylovorans]|uniref:transposase n=1 Tax=Caldibacillus thermoamylovorans TaxID=35841 RepID=UPI001D06DF7B
KYPRGTMFVLEDLTGVRSATEKVQVKNRYVSISWAFYQFRQMLEYKAQLNGQKVIVVDPKYTSQTCPKCGHVEKANRNKKLHL